MRGHCTEFVGSTSPSQGARRCPSEGFLLELGKGFCFVARQKRLTLEGDHFFVDLVYYNRLLRCFVLVDLKLGKLTQITLPKNDAHVLAASYQMYLPSGAELRAAVARERRVLERTRRLSPEVNDALGEKTRV